MGAENTEPRTNHAPSVDAVHATADTPAKFAVLLRGFPTSLHIELNAAAVADDALGASEPGAVLARDARTRTYAAVLCDAAGSVVRRYALKLDRALTGRDVGGTRGRDAGHARRAVEHLQQLCQAGVRTPQILPLSAEHAGGPIGPLLFCRQKRCLFAPRSPVSGGVLTNCADPKLLADAAVSAASEVGQVLYCAADAAEGGEGPLYALVPADDLPSVARDKVGDETQCYRDQGRVVAQRAQWQAQQPALHDELTREFPCYTCDQAAQCYPSEGRYARVLERLEPFLAATGHATCSERYELTLDEWADLLGGEPLHHWCERTSDAQERRRRTAIANQLLSLGFGEFGASAAARQMGRLAWRKWSLLRQTLECLVSLYRAGRPHLYLSARNVAVRLPARDVGGAFSSGVDVALTGLDAALPDANEDASLGPGGGAGILPAAEALPDAHDGASLEMLAKPEPIFMHPDAVARYEAGERRVALRGETGLVEDLHSFGVVALRVLWTNATQELGDVLFKANGLLAQKGSHAASSLLEPVRSEAWRWASLAYNATAAPTGNAGTPPDTLLAEMLSAVLGCLDAGLTDERRCAWDEQTERLEDTVDRFTAIERALLRNVGSGGPQDARVPAALTALMNAPSTRGDKGGSQ